MHFIFAKNIKDMSHSSSPKTPEAIQPPKPATVSPDAQMSSVQSTGPCVYKEKCVCPGKTLFACVQCESRFHHLCASSVGGSDDMNMCRANCDGTPPQRTTATKDTSPQKTTATKDPPPVNPKAPTKKLTQKAEFFVAKPAGEDVTTIPGDSDEDVLLLKNANQQEMAHKKSQTLVVVTLDGIGKVTRKRTGTARANKMVQDATTNVRKSRGSDYEIGQGETKGLQGQMDWQRPRGREAQGQGQ